MVSIKEKFKAVLDTWGIKDNEGKLAEALIEQIKAPDQLTVEGSPKHSSDLLLPSNSASSTVVANKGGRPKKLADAEELVLMSQPMFYFVEHYRQAWGKRKRGTEIRTYLSEGVNVEIPVNILYIGKLPVRETVKRLVNAPNHVHAGQAIQNIKLRPLQKDERKSANEAKRIAKERESGQSKNKEERVNVYVTENSQEFFRKAWDKIVRKDVNNCITEDSIRNAYNADKKELIAQVLLDITGDKDRNDIPAIWQNCSCRSKYNRSRNRKNCACDPTKGESCNGIFPLKKYLSTYYWYDDRFKSDVEIFKFLNDRFENVPESESEIEKFIEHFLADEGDQLLKLSKDKLDKMIFILPGLEGDTHEPDSANLSA